MFSGLKINKANFTEEIIDKHTYDERMKKIVMSYWKEMTMILLCILSFPQSCKARRAGDVLHLVSRAESKNNGGLIIDSAGYADMNKVLYRNENRSKTEI